MARKHRSETKWLSPATTRRERKVTRPPYGRTPYESFEDVPIAEGEFYVLKHTSEEPTTIALCLGDRQRALDVATIDALIADLQDARSVIAPRRSHDPTTCTDGACDHEACE